MNELDMSFTRKPSSGPGFVRELLINAPVTDVQLVEEQKAIQWASWEEFWKWCWSHRWREILENLSDRQLAYYRAEAEHAIRGRSVIEGRISATVGSATRV